MVAAGLAADSAACAATGVTGGESAGLVVAVADDTEGKAETGAEGEDCFDLPPGFCTAPDFCAADMFACLPVCLFLLAVPLFRWLILESGVIGCVSMER